jgi:hypothetical protein
MSVTERNVQVTLSFEPPADCPLHDIESEIGKVLVDREGETCRCDVIITVEAGGEQGSLVAQIAGDVGRCAGTVFEEYNCVPEVTEVGEARITVRTYVDETADIDGLLADLGEVCEDVTLERVSTDFDRGMASTFRDVDLSSLTAKQRAAMERAIRAGYYARPREISLAELASSFDISEQALAQRLARAEENVMKQLFRE